MATSFISWVYAIWESMYNSDNPGIITGLLIGYGAMLFAYWRVSSLYKARLKDKEIRIEELVEERNEFKELLFKSKGIPLKTTKKGK